MLLTWMPLLTVLQNFLNRESNVFKYSEIALNRNKILVYFLVLFMYFSNCSNVNISPGTLLPHLVQVMKTQPVRFL
jgi:hypothetical protein